MIEKEIEFKNLLTDKQYNLIFDKFDLGKTPTINNSNYYYDSAQEDLKNANSALRIRHTRDKREITLKIKGEFENIEINVPLNKSSVPEEISFTNLPTQIKQQLESRNIIFKTLTLIQKIETIRKEKKINENTLVLDKTKFSNNIIDYELEFEVKDYNSGKEKFESILKELDIKSNPALPKIARAIKYNSKN